MAKRRAGSAVMVVDENDEVLNLPTASPPGTPSNEAGTVQGAPGGYPVKVTSSDGYQAELIFQPTAAAYTALDVMGTPQKLVFKNKITKEEFKGGEFMITSIQFEVGHTAVVSGETSYNLHLYNAHPAPSGHADNDAWNLLVGDRKAYISEVSLGTPVDKGASLRVETDGINKQITVPPGGVMSAELVTVGGFTVAGISGTDTQARRVIVHGVAF